MIIQGKHCSIETTEDKIDISKVIVDYIDYIYETKEFENIVMEEYKRLLDYGY